MRQKKPILAAHIHSAFPPILVTKLSKQIEPAVRSIRSEERILGRPDILVVVNSSNTTALSCCTCRTVTSRAKVKWCWHICWRRVTRFGVSLFTGLLWVPSSLQRVCHTALPNPIREWTVTTVQNTQIFKTRNSLFRNACHTERRPFRIWVRCIEGVYLRNTLFRIPQTHSHQAVWDTVFILQSHSIGNLHHEQSSMKISLGNIIFIGVEWWKWHWFVWNLSLRLDMNTARNFYVAIDMQVIFWVNMCKNMLFWLCYCLIFRRKWRPRPGSCSLIVEDESRLTMTKVCFSLDVSLELLVSK